MRSVLVFRSAALGDFIMSAPALTEIRRCFPSHRVLLLTIQSSSRSQRNKVARYAGEGQRAPWVDLAIPHLVDEVITLRSVSDLGYLWQVRRLVRTYKVETAIVLSDVWAPWRGRWMKRLLLGFLVGAVPVLGWRGPSDPRKLAQRGQLKHHVHGPMQFLSEMAPPKQYVEENLVFDLRPGPEAVRWVSAWLAEHHLADGKRLIAVAPGSIQPHKRWPLKFFEALIVSILARYSDAVVIVIGTAFDKALGETLTALAPEKIHNLAGLSNIAQSGALLQRCVLLVGNDGGAMHLGDAMGCKVVSIVPGIEYPDSIEPWHNKHLAVRHPIECSPCYNFVYCPLEHNRCMTELPVEEVLSRCMLVLEGGSASVEVSP